MPAEYKYDAFISYRHGGEDEVFARRLLEELEGSGFKVVIDQRDFSSSATFLEEMERCIKESQYTLAIVSPRYLESGNALEEAIIGKVLDMAERRRRLLPLTIATTELPTWMYNITGIDFTAQNPLIDPFEKLKRDLRRPPP